MKTEFDISLLFEDLEREHHSKKRNVMLFIQASSVWVVDSVGAQFVCEYSAWLIDPSMSGPLGEYPNVSRQIMAIDLSAWCGHLAE